MKLRQKLVNKLLDVELELKKYDEFFDNLTPRQTIYEELMFDSSPVKVISWDKEEGTVLCEFSYGSEIRRQDLSIYRLTLTPNKYVF